MNDELGRHICTVIDPAEDVFAQSPQIPLILEEIGE